MTTSTRLDAPERIASLTRSSLGRVFELGALVALAYAPDAVDVDARDAHDTVSRGVRLVVVVHLSRRRLGRRRGTNAPASRDFRRRSSARAR